MVKTFVLLASIAAIVPLMTYAYDKSMQMYCTKLADQAGQYSLFWVTELDYSECKDVHGIIINAAIK